MTNPILERLKQEFPDDEIEMPMVLDPNDLTPKYTVFMNGKAVRDAWYSAEEIQDAAVLKGLASPDARKLDEARMGEEITLSFIEKIRRWKKNNGIK